MTFQVIDCCFQALNVILKMPQTNIASTAKQSANFIRFMVMIDVQQNVRRFFAN